uniref:Cilia-and flagella-associated protein 221-like protein isoform x1 n=1 Tax=Triatoma infestans TaxID=30076 RepID=A0A161ML90_TRIIF
MTLDMSHLDISPQKLFTFSPSESKIGFLFIAICNNPDFAITPTRGIISDKPVKIKIFYKPTACITFRASVQVYLPSIMSTPLCFTVSAYTDPRL